MTQLGCALAQPNRKAAMQAGLSPVHNGPKKWTKVRKGESVVFPLEAV